MKTKTFDEYYSQPSIHTKTVKTQPESKNHSFSNELDSISKNFVIPFMDDTSDSQYFIKSYKKKLLSAIDSAVKSINTQKSDMRKLRKSPYSQTQKRTNSLKSLQQKNIERIKQEENNQVEEALNSFREAVNEQKTKESKKRTKQSDVNYKNNQKK